MDANLLRFYEGGELKIPGSRPRRTWRMTTCPTKAPDVPEVLTIPWKRAIPSPSTTKP